MICDDGVRVGFDYLIIGNGITTNHFGIPGAAEYTMSMYTRAEALQGARHDLRQPGDHRRPSDPNTGGFTVVMVGGGADRGGDGRSAGRAQDRDHPVDLPRAQSGAGPRGAGRDGRAPAGAVRRLAAAVRAAGVDQARRGRPAEDRDLRGARRSGRLQGRLLDAGRSGDLGGRRVR